MCLREHILDFQTGINIPVLHTVGLHFRNPFILQALPLTHTLHDGKGKLRPQSLVQQIDHDIISTSDDTLQRTRSVVDQILRISQPDISTMAQTGYFQKLIKGGRARQLQYTAHKRRSKLR